MYPSLFDTHQWETVHGKNVTRQLHDYILSFTALLVATAKNDKFAAIYGTLTIWDLQYTCWCIFILIKAQSETGSYGRRLALPLHPAKPLRFSPRTTHHFLCSLPVNLHVPSSDLHKPTLGECIGGQCSAAHLQDGSRCMLQL